MAEPQDRQLISLADYERAAARALDPEALGYFAGGAADEITMRDNESSWARLAIRPRVLVGVEERHPGVTLLGQPRPHPLIVAPMAFQRLAHPEGEIAIARAAAATGTIMTLATLGTTSVPALAQAQPDATRWFQLYVFSDRGVTRELVAEAVENGYEALVITVDLPVVGRRERELRAPPRAQPHAVWSALAPDGPMTPMEFARLVDPSLTWDDIAQFAAAQPLPVIVKGILTAEDAIRAAQHGARGIVVSNHGGRQLDTVLPGAEALAPIVDAVGDSLEVIADGGIRRGTDVLKALALGARAVMIGRPVLWGLCVDGADGARGVLEILLQELDLALALAGAPTPAALDRSFVARAPWVGQQA
jgi:isopentenyl diphosphate isomerase/L-lactate dehydrogenase-like FMN-dependent dehydrogenase